LDTISSRAITSLTGVHGRNLHELCNALGVGKTKQGAERQFTIPEASLLTLAARLMLQGLRRSEAIAMALAAKDDLARFLRNPDSSERWLLAWRVPDAEQWNVEVSDTSGSPEVEDHEGSQAFGHIVVNLAPMVRKVTDAAAGHG
jgi:hypothetical protein